MKLGVFTVLFSELGFEAMLDRMYVLMNTNFMLHKIPQFDHYYVACLKDDPAQEPVAASYSAPGVLAEAAHKTGRAKVDFELREVSKEEYERSSP